MKKSAMFFVFLFGVLLLTYPVFAANVIKIGVIDTYSGAGANVTKGVLDGLKFVINNVNAGGGILGKKVELLIRDDKFKPDIALSHARDLVEREKVDLLMGTWNSSCALAVSEYAKKEKMPFIVTFAKSEHITGEKGHRYVFNAGDNTAMAGKAAALVLSKKPYINYWIAGEDYDYSHSLADTIWNDLKTRKPDVKLIGQTYWKVGDADVVPYISSILAAKPDALIVTTGGAGIGNFMRTAKNMGISKTLPMYAHTSIELSTVQSLGQEAPEGMLGTASYLFYFPATKQNKTFVAEFNKIYSRYPAGGEFNGVNAANLVVAAFKKAGMVDKEKFINALEGLTIDSPVGKLEMRACDHQLLLPMFSGITARDPKYDFVVSNGTEVVAAKDYIQTCEQILKLRKK